MGRDPSDGVTREVYWTGARLTKRRRARRRSSFTRYHRSTSGHRCSAGSNPSATITPSAGGDVRPARVRWQSGGRIPFCSPRRFAKCLRTQAGRVPEWLKAPVLNSGVPARCLLCLAVPFSQDLLTFSAAHRPKRPTSYFDVGWQFGWQLSQQRSHRVIDCPAALVVSLAEQVSIDAERYSRGGHGPAGG